MIGHNYKTQLKGAGFDLLGAMSPTQSSTANQMQAMPMTSQPMTTTAMSSNPNRSVGTTWANGSTGKVNIDLANLGKPVQQKKSVSMNELKSQAPSSGNPGMSSNDIIELLKGSVSTVQHRFFRGVGSILRISNTPNNITYSNRL